MSSLQLSMLNKRSEENTLIPSDNEMLFTRQMREDLNDQDIMTYSNTNTEENAGEDGVAFGEGGAIMEALYKANPSLKPKQALVAKKKPAVKKPTKAELAKIKRAAEEKKKAEEEKRKQEENARKVEEAK